MARLFLAAIAAAVLASATARVVNLDDSSFQRAVSESSEQAQWRPWQGLASRLPRKWHELRQSMALPGARPS